MPLIWKLSTVKCEWKSIHGRNTPADMEILVTIIVAAVVKKNKFSRIRTDEWNELWGFWDTVSYAKAQHIKSEKNSESKGHFLTGTNRKPKAYKMPSEISQANGSSEKVFPKISVFVAFSSQASPKTKWFFFYIFIDIVYYQRILNWRSHWCVGTWNNAWFCIYGPCLI